MFILSFQKSRSPNFQKALSLALELGAIFDGDTVRLDIPVTKLLYAYKDLFPLIELIHGWKSNSATYKDKKVHYYRFIFQIWNTVRRCAQEHNDSMNKRHCWHGIDSPGWSCRQLNRIFYDFQGQGNYRTSNRYWYNFGEFSQGGEWIINKNYLLEKLNAEAQEKALDTCPYFSLDQVREIIQDLPAKIVPDNLLFRKYFVRHYKNCERVEKPVNIRHMIPDTKPPDLFKAIIERDYLIEKTSLN